jgi:sulfite exporter TauE/SafE
MTEILTYFLLGFIAGLVPCAVILWFLSRFLENVARGNDER